MSQAEDNILNGWVETTLGEVSKVQTGPFGSQLKNEQYITGGTPVITVEHIEDFRIKEFDYPSVTNEDRDRLSKYLLKEGDIVFTRVGSVDLSAYVSKNQDGWMFSSRMLSVRPSKKVDSKYLSYFFRQPTFRNFIFRISVGATMPSINTSILKSIPITFPHLTEQKAIAKALTAFDDKIENLRAQNDTLEQTAQTIFTEWFLPSRQAGGKYQIGDELPEGWSLRSFYSIGDFINGSAFKSSDFLENRDGLPIIKIAELKNGITESTAFTQKDVDPKYLINDYDILFSWSGSPETSIDIFLWTNDKAVLNQHTFNVKIKDKNMKAWYYFLLKYHKPLFIQLAKMKQTTGLGHVTISNLKEYSFIYPNKSLLDSKAPLFTTFFKKIASNRKQIQTLSQTRDTLLPKLMSGQLRVKEV